MPHPQVTGTLRVHPRGFGFLEHPTADDQGASSFIAPPDLDGFLDGDEVTATLVTEDDDRTRAESLALVVRNRTQLYGIAEHHNTLWRLRVDPNVANSPWALDQPDDWSVEDGDGVVATITGLRVIATDAYEDPYSAEAVAACVSLRHNLSLTPPDDAPGVAAEIADVLTRASSPDRPTSRVDLRDQLTLTIDADHSQDLDDALSVTPADDQGVIAVTVSIADVAEYVLPGSALDREARRAATSVYLGEYVRPMLPRALSENALSLIPDQDRDTLSVTLYVDQEGFVTSAGVFESQIRSDLRVSYQDVADLLEGGDDHSLVDPAVKDALFWLHTAAVRIGTQRDRRGGLSSSRLEGSGGDADDGAAVAHDLIERLMVAANEEVAAWLVTHGAPGPYRAHPAPAEGAGAEIDRFASNFGFRLGLAGTLTPHSLRSVETTLSASKDDRVDVVWELLLGHLGRAVYQGDPSPHFGLGSDNYLHFTSPLRRYADLEVHRRCKEIIHGTTLAPADVAHALLCEHLNLQTGLAARAERDVLRTTRQAQLARHGMRDTYNGRIVGFAKPGVRVAFDDGQLTGLVRWRAFDRARYEVDEGDHSISSPGQPTFALGDPVLVTIAQVDLERGEVDLTRVRH